MLKARVHNVKSTNIMKGMEHLIYGRHNNTKWQQKYLNWIIEGECLLPFIIIMFDFRIKGILGAINQIVE